MILSLATEISDVHNRQFGGFSFIIENSCFKNILIGCTISPANNKANFNDRIFTGQNCKVLILGSVESKSSSAFAYRYFLDFLRSTELRKLSEYLKEAELNSVSFKS